MAIAPEKTSVSFTDIEEARRRMGDVLDETPLAHSDYLSHIWGCNAYVKLENLHFTGSFKERGALNKLLCLAPEERQRGVITASAGNHGQAVAYHAKRLGIPAIVVMPINTPLIKVQNTESFGAQAVLHGASYDEASEHAHKLRGERDLTYVHGFDDPMIIAGQGTLGLELLEQCPYLDAIVVPIGGGGLIAGVVLAMKETNPRIKVYGVQTAALPSMKVALEAGEPRRIEGPRTIADGIAVRNAGALPLQIIRKYVDDIVTVTEEEIASAILLMLEREKTLVEGAGAVGVAALNNHRLPVAGLRVACVLSGGNIDVNILSRIISKGLVKDGRMVKLHVLVPDYPGELARILQIIADLRANILEIDHNRAFSKAQIGETGIDLVLETRGETHIEELRNELLRNGFKTTKQQV